MLHYINQYLAKDEASRTLQWAGMVRFLSILLQGIILVKAGVSMHMVGQLELLFFLANFFQFFWQNGSHQAMMSWREGDARPIAARAIFTGMHYQAILAVLFLGITAFLPLGENWTWLLRGERLIWLLIYVFFSIPVGAIVYVFLQRRQFRSVLWYTGITQSIQVILILGIMLGGSSMDVLLMALAAFAVMRWLAVLILGGWSARVQVRGEGWIFFVFAVPLVLHALSGGLMDYVDGWIVSLFFGEEAFAVYRFGARELPFNALLIGGLMSGLVHRFRISGQVDAEVIREETKRLIRLLLPLNCLLILLSPTLYRFFYNSEFLLSARIFNIYVLTLIARVVLNPVYCYVYHRNWVLTFSAIAEIVLNILLSLILLQWIGLIGIPLATVIAYLLQKGYLVYYVHSRFGVPVTAYIPVRMGLGYFGLMIACAVIADGLYFGFGF